MDVDEIRKAISEDRYEQFFMSLGIKPQETQRAMIGGIDTANPQPIIVQGGAAELPPVETNEDGDVKFLIGGVPA